VVAETKHDEAIEDIAVDAVDPFDAAHRACRAWNEWIGTGDELQT
jgi:hypothetical protein